MGEHPGAPGAAAAAVRIEILAAKFDSGEIV